MTEEIVIPVRDGEDRFTVTAIDGLMLRLSQSGDDFRIYPEEAAALWPLIKAFAETGQLADTSDPQVRELDIGVIEELVAERDRLKAAIRKAAGIEEGE